MLGCCVVADEVCHIRVIKKSINYQSEKRYCCGKWMDRMISNASSRDYDEDNDVIDPDRSGPQDFELISRIGN